MDGDRLTATDLADAFVAFAFDAHLADVHAERVRQVGAHRVDKRRELRTLGQDGCVDVLNAETVLRNDRGGPRGGADAAKEGQEQA